eukprot:2131176-Amphidinium_carterae.1
MLLEHIEFFSGIPASYPLREVVSYTTLLERIQMETRLRGRLSASTRLPLRFDEKDGLYTIDDMDLQADELYVRFNVTRAIAKVSASSFRKPPGDLSACFIRFNHSESLAEIAAPDTKSTIQLRGHFKD